jgi:hypothetical protein
MIFFPDERPIFADIHPSFMQKMEAIYSSDVLEPFTKTHDVTTQKTVIKSL